MKHFYWSCMNFKKIKIFFTFFQNFKLNFFFKIVDFWNIFWKLFVKMNFASEFLTYVFNANLLRNNNFNKLTYVFQRNMMNAINKYVFSYISVWCRFKMSNWCLTCLKKLMILIIELKINLISLIWNKFLINSWKS